MKNAVGERKEVEYKWNIAVTYFVKSDLFEIDYQVTKEICAHSLYQIITLLFIPQPLKFTVMKLSNYCITIHPSSIPISLNVKLSIDLNFRAKPWLFVIRIFFRICQLLHNRTTRTFILHGIIKCHTILASPRSRSIRQIVRLYFQRQPTTSKLAPNTNNHIMHWMSLFLTAWHWWQ